TDKCPAIFEAAFEHDGRRIRVDVLERASEGKWALYEIKSSTSVHPEHYHDVAFQADVVRGAHVDLAAIYIGHVNSDYRRGTEGINSINFFRFVPVHGHLAGKNKQLKTNLTNMIRVMRSVEPPVVDPGLQCRRPYQCEFIEQCWTSL